MPSVQLQNYLQLRASGASVALACEQSGIGAGEAELWERDIASGEVVLPRVGFSDRPSGDENRQGASRAHVHVHEGDQSKEGEMARGEETTISVNGGPDVPLSTVKEALDIVQGKGVKPATDTGQRLKLYIERAERLDAEIKDLNGDKSDLFKEMKSNGFDTPTIKRIIKLRKMETHQRQEAAALLDTYLNAIGMTPIEHAIAMAA